MNKILSSLSGWLHQAQSIRLARKFVLLEPTEEILSELLNLLSKEESGFDIDTEIILIDYLLDKVPSFAASKIIEQAFFSKKALCYALVASGEGNGETQGYDTIVASAIVKKMMEAGHLEKFIQEGGVDGSRFDIFSFRHGMQMIADIVSIRKKSASECANILLLEYLSSKDYSVKDALSILKASSSNPMVFYNEELVSLLSENEWWRYCQGGDLIAKKILSSIEFGRLASFESRKPAKYERKVVSLYG